jgi:threonine/homoserine efflux transporter RhtA
VHRDTSALLSVLGPWWGAVAALSGLLVLESSLAHNRSLALVAIVACAALITDAAARIAQNLER